MSKNNIGFNINKFTNGNSENVKHELVKEVDIKTKPTKKKSKKTTTSTESNNSIAPVASTSMSYVQENIPYMNAYAETNMQLDESINQLNALGTEIVSELQMVRNSKTLRNKYNIINDMTQTATSIISSKLAAIKEKNSTINAINKLELDRLKQIKVSASEEDDNARIANLYDAFINTPVGAGPGILGPSVQDVITGGVNNPIPVMSIGNDQEKWENNLDPAQNRMVLEAKGAIETVVMYDNITGNRWFEIVDKNTYQPVPNVEKPDNSYIYDLDINVKGGFAKDVNRNITYPLIVVNNGDVSITEY